MTYDFTTVQNRRGQGSSKWQAMDEAAPHHGPEAVPFSVADMEFATAPEIVAALHELCDSAILGYTMPTSSYLDAVCEWQRQRHSWDVDPSWIVTSPGVVPALGYGIEAATAPGDQVIIQPPVYYPFSEVIEQTDRKIARNPLRLVQAGYQLDLDGFEALCKDPATTAFILCNPHNPVGRVWSREELASMADICAAHGVTVIADEIHGDLILEGYEHFCFGRLLEKRPALKAIVCTAPSKTFNLAGLQCSNIFIPDQELRERFAAAAKNAGVWNLNCFAYRACEAAYRQGSPWLRELLQVIQRNYDLVKEHMTNSWPKSWVAPLEGTYLAWIDLRFTGAPAQELEQAMQAHDLFFDEGAIFGPEGEGFERWNLACPTSLILEALPRLDAALRDLCACDTLS